MPVEPNTNSILKLLTALSPKKCDTLSKVRVGLSADGGYVLPDDFDGVQGMLSIGVGPDVSFDHALAQKGIPSYQYDHTVEKIRLTMSCSIFINKVGLRKHRVILLVWATCLNAIICQIKTI